VEVVVVVGVVLLMGLLVPAAERELLAMLEDLDLPGPASH
jgi:hypothetical protein